MPVSFRFQLPPSHKSALNGPQRAQRCLLRLGQSPDPGDSESLVGSVTPQSSQLLAALQVPQGDGPVIPATGQPEAIGAPPDRTDRPLMRLSHPHALPALDIPPAQHAVTTPTDQHLPARAPGDGIVDTGMPRKGSHALSALHIPHQQLPSAFDAASTGQPAPIWAPGHARDYPLMSRQPLQQCAVGGVPQIHVTIIASADQARAVWTPRHVTDPGLLPTAQPTLGARRHLPYRHAMQIGSAGQPPTI